MLKQQLRQMERVGQQGGGLEVHEMARDMKMVSARACLCLCACVSKDGECVRVCVCV